MGYNRPQTHMKKINLGILLCLLLCMPSCLKESPETIVLPSGTISKDVIPEEIKDLLQTYMPIYEGIRIPTISGFYLADNITLLFNSNENDSFKPGHRFAKQYTYFGPQSSNGLIYEYEDKQGSSRGSSDLVQVTGKDDCFTAFYINETFRDYDEDGVEETWSKTSTVLSGKISEDGIKEWKLAIIMVDKTDPFGIIMYVNDFRVFYEDDDIVARIPDWRTSGAPARIKASESEKSISDADDNLPNCNEQ